MGAFFAVIGFLGLVVSLVLVIITKKRVWAISVG
jgi:hypothetical protein